MKDSLDGCKGKSASGRLVYPAGYFPGYIHSGKRDIVPEQESVSVSGLPVLKSRILFCIPVEELDLESGVIDKKDLRCHHLKISTEKNPPDYFVTASEFRDHDLDFTPEGLPFASALKGLPPRRQR